MLDAGGDVMAQKEGSLRIRARMLARRYGLRGAKGAAAACIALVVLVAVLGVLRMASSGQVTVERHKGSSESSTILEEAQGSNKGTAQSTKEQQRANEVLVHVDGAVASPGVYALKGNNPRINDAVTAAGGLTSEADTYSLNLASPVADGQKVYVSKVGERTPQANEDTESQANNTEMQPTAGTQDVSASDSRININTAAAEELQTLAGIGEATSAAIVKDRESNGPFGSVEDLMRVSGIGEKKFEKIRDKICV